jgi:hypothetical protein
MAAGEQFAEQLKKVREDFNDYTTYVRTKALQFCVAMLGVNWAVFGKLFENSGGSMAEVLAKRTGVKESIYFSLFGILLVVLYSFFYSIYLKIEDGRLQADFHGEKRRFNGRNNPDSSYPYAGWTNWVPLLFDFLIIILAGMSMWHFLCAVELAKP